MKHFFDNAVKHDSFQKPVNNSKEVEEIEEEGGEFYDGDVTSEDEIDTEGYIVLEEVFPSGSIPKMTISTETRLSTNISEPILERETRLSTNISETLFTPRTEDILRDSGNFSSYGDSTKFKLESEDEFEDHPAILEFMK
jgi:hypothetical protein